VSQVQQQKLQASTAMAEKRYRAFFSVVSVCLSDFAQTALSSSSIRKLQTDTNSLSLEV